jgi:hypothetical protein
LSEKEAGSIAIRAALDRNLEDLERNVGSGSEVGSIFPDDRMSVMAITVNGAGAKIAQHRRTAAGQNADGDLRGSQVQTALDRGDYISQDEAVGKQKEERSRKPERESGPLGNQDDAVNFDYDDRKYVLARRLAAINTLAHLLAPEEIARLRKEAEGPAMTAGDGAEPLGGEPESVVQGRESSMGDVGTTGDVKPMTSPAADPVQNLQEVVRQRGEDVQEAERDLASKKEVLEQLQSALQETNVGPEVATAVRRQSNGTARAIPTVASKTNGVAGRVRTAGDKDTPETVPGGGNMGSDRFSYVERQYEEPKYKGASDADDALARQAREAKDKPAEGASRDADAKRTTSRDAGDYPQATRRLGGRSKVSTAKIDWSGYDRVLTPRTAGHEEPDLSADFPQAEEHYVEEGGERREAARKTAADDDLQPQAPVAEHGTYEAAEMGDTNEDADKDISRGTTPTLESPATEKVVGDANRELAERSRESQRGSTVGSTGGAKTAHFAADEIERLKKECKRIDDAYDDLRARAVRAKKSLVRGEEIVRALQPRLATLKRCGDAIQAVAKAEGGDRKQIREKTRQVLVLARKEGQEATRDAALIEAAFVEAERSRESERRVGPAFALAVHQVKAGFLAVEELPAKVAEYSAMDRKTFETVAKTVQEVGSRARRTGQGKTAGRLPSMPEDNLFRSVDELDGIFSSGR